MSKYYLTFGLALTLLLGCCADRAAAQALLKVVDDVIIITAKGASNKEKTRTHQHLPGAGEGALPASPGSDTPRLGEPLVSAPSSGVLSAAAEPSGQRFGGAATPRIASPNTAPSQKAPLYGPLELLTEEDEGPADGLTLDVAIDHLVSTNYDLLTKYQEIPKAQADILSAGLRLNPFLFASTDGIPYGNYSQQRPGATNYEATVAQPIDINQKRKIRVRVAQQAKRVLEAQYQDAVRLQIDNLYTAYVDVLAARQTLRATRTGLAGLGEVVKTTRNLVDKGQQPKTELDRVMIQQYNAEVAVHADEVALAQTKRNLATLLAVPPQQADCLKVRGTIRDTSPALPCIDELIQTALQVRPDLAAFRLGIDRATAAVQLAKAERIEDIFMFYTPFNIANNAPTGGQTATSWGVGVLLPLPVFNRNQGNIRRAQVNVSQTQIELAGAERQVANEVQRAAAEYASSRIVVQRYEQDILAAAQRLRDEKYRLFTKGQEGLISFLQAQSEYNDVVRQYLENLVRHRRNMLKLNTAVGQRVAP